MSATVSPRVVDRLLADIEISETSYQKAIARYDDISDWFCRPSSSCASFSPHIYPQGSFRLGTVVRPVAGDGEFDLDVGCRLQVGISKASHTQRELKEIVRRELESYRVGRQIEQRLEALRRCWRLKYRDEAAFHMDVVPSIPESGSRKRSLQEAIQKSGSTAQLAEALAALTGAITDTSHPAFNQLAADWRISNSEGYAQWFEYRMKLASSLLAERAMLLKASKIDDVPAYSWKSPLQGAVQVLKRHRDVMFAGTQARQPISIIITTLAAQSYRGATDVIGALSQILGTMDTMIRPAAPRIPNPVNPAEDFADKWYEPANRHLDLEGNFRRWLAQAREDFDSLSSTDPAFLSEHFRKAFGTTRDRREMDEIVRAGSTLLTSAVAASGLAFPNRPLVPSRPAGFA